MFCVRCGARNPDDADFCHKCGSSLYREEVKEDCLSAKNTDSPVIGVTNSVMPSGTRRDETSLTAEQRELVAALLPKDQKQNECHGCGRTEKLRSWDFGLGKKISTKLAWGGNGSFRRFVSRDSACPRSWDS